MSDIPPYTADIPKVSLPKVTTFSECDDNFVSLSDLVMNMIVEMKDHREHTQQNLTRIASEANDNINRLSDDIRTILSSQAMMVGICIITVCVVVIILKGFFDFLSNVSWGELFTHAEAIWQYITFHVKSLG
jgi:hypothetical protein